MRKLLVALVIIVSMGTTGVVCAQEFHKGVEAYNSGAYATAVKQWKVLAEQGHVSAQFNLGLMYYAGKGVTQDYKEAVKWWRKAAEQGHVRAQYNLGVTYYKGDGVVRNDKEALKRYRKSAEQGDAEAQYNLGGMYASALKQWKVLAEQGGANAQFNLGVAYYEGLGVLKDTVAAHMWFNIAAANGREYAAKKRDKVAKKLSSAELVKAQKMAKRCMKSDYKDCD